MIDPSADEAVPGRVVLSALLMVIAAGFTLG
jgi:hypothetical protein